jgi:hypothetical protein
MAAPLFTLALALTAAPPAAGPERLAVLPVLLAVEARVDVEQVFTAVEAAAQWRGALRPMTVGDYYFHGGQELARRSLACGPDAACITRELRPMDAGLGLLVLVNGELTPPLVSLLLLDARAGSVVAEWAGQVPGGPEAVEGAIRARAAEFLDAQGYLQSGRLRVAAQPPQAALVVDDGAQPDLGRADTFTLPPGHHTVRVSAEGHEARTLSAEVRPGEVTELAVTLAEADSVLSSPWLWLGVGAVAAGVAAGVAAASLGGGAGPTCACVVTRDQPTCACP